MTEPIDEGGTRIENRPSNPQGNRTIPLVIGVVIIFVSLFQVVLILPLVGRRLGSIEGQFNELVREGIVNESLLRAKLGDRYSGDPFYDAFTIFGLRAESGAAAAAAFGAVVLGICGTLLIIFALRKHTATRECPSGQPA